MEIIMLNLTVVIAIILFVFLTIYFSVKIVPQSEVYVVERFGKYHQILGPGLSLIVPFIDSIAHRVSILERQISDLEISVITKDNVEVILHTSIFFRVIDASRTVYRIRDVNGALRTAASSIVRSAAGKLELDGLQSSREAMNAEIAENLLSAAEIWGIEITRTEIIDVIIDEATKEAQRQQLNAERKRRATVAEAEGEKRSVELSAEAELYKAKKQAEAIKVRADADAYSVLAAAEADAAQTKMLAKVINDKGQPAIDFEIMKRQVEAMANIASSASSKTVVLPTEITKVIGAATTLLETIPIGKSGKNPS
jgi:regulator of protease activity HflC (stomatin/prohibitin superfamily)